MVHSSWAGVTRHRKTGAKKPEVAKPTKLKKRRVGQLPVSGTRQTTAERTRGSTLKTVVIARSGNLSVGDHLSEMRSWLAERNIVARELTILHLLQFRVVFRAVFDTDDHADQFVQAFG
jgi:hypothetical protein